MKDFTVALYYFNPGRCGSVPPPPAPFTVTWTVPPRTVGNDSLVIIHVNYPVAGFNRNDLQLRASDGTVTTLTGNRSTLMKITENIYYLGLTLSGTLDDDYFVRLRANRVTVDGELAPSANMDSPLFHITTGTLPPNQKAASQEYEGCVAKRSCTREDIIRTPICLILHFLTFQRIRRQKRWYRQELQQIYPMAVLCFTRCRNR